MKKHLPDLLILICLAFLYFRTMAPGLSWAFDGADGGDLVTAASTGGVPHPSGYPTYLLVASLFLKIPVGSLAYRTNLLSGVCTVLTAGLICKIVRSLDQSIFSAMIASLAFGTYQLVWSQAIITEVNALNGLFAALLLYFFITRPSHPLTDFVWGIIAGLGLGNHLIILFMLPLVFAVEGRRVEVPIIEVPARQTIFTRIAIYARRLAGLCLGLSVYFLIPIRASAEAPVNWGNAVSWDGLTWLVSGRLYWGRLNDLNGNYLVTGLQAWSHFLIDQLGILGLLLVFIVIAFLFERSRFYIASGWLVLIYSIFSILYYSPDSYVYLMPALISFSIWMGLGSEWVIGRISTKYRYFKPAAELGIISFILIHAILEIPKMDLSADHAAERYAQAILNSAPNKAIIFTEGDEATFTLWYFHYSYHQRPDIALVSSDLLSQTWYKDVLNYTYPDLIMGDQSDEQDIILNNPLRPVCKSRSDLQEVFSCSP